MPVVFPHANDFQISDAVFRQAWADTLRDHDHNNQGPDLPRLRSIWPLTRIEENGYQLSLEYLLRKLVPRVWLTTAQATQEFLAANNHIVTPTPARVVNPVTGRMVMGVQLLPAASTMDRAQLSADPDPVRIVNPAAGRMRRVAGSQPAPAALDMIRAQFLEDPDVAGFLNFFSQCLHNLEVDYQSNYTHIHHADRLFHVTGVTAAHASYAWPGKNTFIAPPHPSIYDWATTSGFLGMARTALRNAIATRNDPATWDVVSKILEWGLPPRARLAGLERLREICPGHPGMSISAYLGGAQGVINLHAVNTAAITPALVPYASSGMSKVHSLASPDGLIIFDSRVAATVGECINEYLRRQNANAIPATLEIFIEANHPGNNPQQRVPMPLANGINHYGFVYDHRWIECQVRVSWMFEAVLARNPNVFPGLPMPDRMHCLEAACFMMGAYLQPGPFAGRSFNFARC